jgi:hypothetical protein
MASVLDFQALDLAPQRGSCFSFFSIAPTVIGE